MTRPRAALAAAIARATASVAGALTRGRVRSRGFRVHRPGRIRISSSGLVTVGVGTVVEADLRLTVHGARLDIGRDVFIGKNATITAFSDVSIGDGALLAENVSVHSEDHGSHADRATYTSAPVRIGARAWLGAGVVVTSGVTIGDGATIGANAVVTRDVPAGATAVGVPARVLPARVP